MPKALKFFKTKDACHCCSLSRVTGDEAVSKQPTNDTFKSKLYLDVCLQSSRCGTILSLSPAPSPSPYSSFPSFSSATFSPLFFFSEYHCLHTKTISNCINYIRSTTYHWKVPKNFSTGGHKRRSAEKDKLVALQIICFKSGNN